MSLSPLEILINTAEQREALRQHRSRSMRTVLCHGVFDWIHHGHLEHLEQARAMGDRLIVSVVADRFAEKGRVLQPERWRLKMLNALRCVDLAVLTDQVGPQAHLRLHRPAVYVRGPDYVGRRMPENDVTDELGIECRFTTTVLDISTTKLLRMLHTEFL